MLEVGAVYQYTSVGTTGIYGTVTILSECTAEVVYSDGETERCSTANIELWLMRYAEQSLEGSALITIQRIK